MADEYPTSERRVCQFLEALAVFDPGVDLIGEVAAGQYRLTATDLRDVLAELDAYRALSPHHHRIAESKENQTMTTTPSNRVRIDPHGADDKSYLSPFALAIERADRSSDAANLPHPDLLAVFVDNRYANATPAELAHALTVLAIPGLEVSYTPPSPPLPTEPGLYALANCPSTDRGDVFFRDTGGHWDFDSDVWHSVLGAHEGAAGPLVPLVKEGGAQ